MHLAPSRTEWRILSRPILPIEVYTYISTSEFSLTIAILACLVLFIFALPSLMQSLFLVLYLVVPFFADLFLLYLNYLTPASPVWSYRISFYLVLSICIKSPLCAWYGTPEAAHTNLDPVQNSFKPPSTFTGERGWLTTLFELHCIGALGGGSGFSLT